MTYSKTFDDRLYWKVSRQTYINQGTFDETSEGVRAFVGVRVGEHGGDWKRRIRLRTQAGVPMVSDRFRSHKTLPATGSYKGYDDPLPNPPWDNQFRNQYGGGWYYVPDPVNINHLSLNAQDAENAALVKIHKRIKSREEAFNSGPFLAELREALQMIRRPASALQNLITSYIKDMRKKKPAWLRGVPEHRRHLVLRNAVAGSWLEYSFGWRPTISDVEAGAEALARFVDETNNGGKRSYVRLQASGRSMAQVDLGTSLLWPNTWQELSVQQEWSTQHTVKYIVGHLLDIQAQSLGDGEHFARTFGLNNWKNIVLGAYEVIPFSWLFDYFNNLSDILEVWATPVHGVQWIVKTNRTSSALRYRIKHTGARNVPPFTHVTFRDLPGAANYFRTTVNRTCPTSLGVPVWVPESPWSSPGKVANMMAVWTSLTSDFYPPGASKGRRPFTR